MGAWHDRTYSTRTLSQPRHLTTINRWGRSVNPNPRRAIASNLILQIGGVRTADGLRPVQQIGYSSIGA
jgi:hypothetical protein